MQQSGKELKLVDRIKGTLLFQREKLVDAKKTVYLHIGVPKTASTTIQEGLYENISELKHLNYLFPEAGRPKNNHKNIFFELCSFPMHQKKFKQEDGTLDQLVEEIQESSFPNFIVSAEHFALFNKQEIARMADAFTRFNTKVIVYVRRQDQVIQSGWAQNFKRYVFNKSLEENIEGELANRNTTYHYDTLLKNWANAFGKENMIVRVFERSQLSGHIFYDFLQTCGIDDMSGFKIPESGNISPTEKTMGLIIEFAKYLDFSKLDPVTLNEIGKKLEIACNKLGWDKGQKFNQIDQALFNKVMDHFEKGNREVAREYLGKDQLFEEVFVESPVTEFSLEEIPQEELMRIFSYVINHLPYSSGD